MPAHVDLQPEIKCVGDGGLKSEVLDILGTRCLRTTSCIGNSEVLVIHLQAASEGQKIWILTTHALGIIEVNILDERRDG